MSYTTETKVYNRTGFNSETIVTLSGKSIAEVTTLVEGFISDAQNKLREDIEYPIRVRNEIHYADGQNNTLDLGPEDDPYSGEGDYDPINGVVEVYNCKAAGIKITKPKPEDCDEWTDYSSTGITSYWSGGGSATITSENSPKVSGSHSVKVIFEGIDSFHYPTTKDLDLFINPWKYLFFWVRSSDVTTSLKVRLYTTSLTYVEEDIVLRQSNVGQYYWIRISAMNNVSAINWGDNVTRLQYIEFTSGGSCTVYIDNLCFSDGWAYSAPSGLLHVGKADNVTGEGPPSQGYPYVIDYSYDPFLSSIPGIMAEACEWLSGVYIIDYLRGIRYRKTSFEVYGATLELDTDASREGLMGIRTYMMKNYWECLRNWGHGSYGMV
jgi:hypothetical protein